MRIGVRRIQQFDPNTPIVSHDPPARLDECLR